MLWLGIVLTILLSLVIFILVRYLKRHFSAKSAHRIWKPIDWRGNHHILKKIVAVFVILLFEVGMFNISNRIAYLPITSPIHGQAEWINTNTQKYLYIQADDRYSLGYLEGQYLASQIVAMKEALIFSGQDFSATYNYTYDQMVAQAQNYVPFIPTDPDLTQMQGMADGCSQGAGWPISFNDILLQNVYLAIFSEGHWVPEEAPC